MWWWIIGTVLMACAGGGIFFAFRSPAFVDGLTAIIAKRAWDAFAPRVLKRKTPEEEEADRESVRMGEDHPVRKQGPTKINWKSAPPK